MPALLLGALIVVPLLELYVIVQVGQQLGVLPTILLLLAVSLLGGYLLRREGRATWSAFRDAAGRGSIPTREVVDGALVLLGGALMLTPGFLTDAVGLLCVLPPTRAALRALLTRYAGARMLGIVSMPSGPRRAGRAARKGPHKDSDPGPGGGEVIDGEVLPPEQ